MKELTNKIKNIARKAARKITSKGTKTKRSLIKPSLKKTRDGKDLEMEVEYYIDLSEDENRKISKVLDDGEKAEEEIIKIFNKRKSRENISDIIEVELDDRYGIREKVSVDTSVHQKVLYDADRKMVAIVSEKRILGPYPKSTPLNPKTPQKQNFGKINTVAKRNSVPTRPSIGTRVISVGKRMEDQKKIISSSRQPIAEADISTELEEHSPPSSIREANTHYPLVSDLFLELSGDNINGYLFVNNLRANLSVTEYKDMMGLVEREMLNIDPILYVATGSRIQDSQEIVLERVDNTAMDAEIIAYKFSMPARNGMLSFRLEYEAQDPVVQYVTRAIREIDRSVNYLEGNSIISSNQENLKVVYKAYNKARKLQGVQEYEWKDFTKMYVLEQKEEQTINSEIKDYLMKVSESFRNRFSLIYDKNNFLNPRNQKVIRKEIKLADKSFTGKSIIDEMFEEEHTFEEAVSKDKAMSEFPLLDRGSLMVPIKNSDDTSSDEEDPYYSLDTARKVLNGLNSGIFNTGRVYILKKFNKNLEHGVSLLKSPLWTNIADPSISSGKYLAKAIIRNGNGVINEEYFMVVKS